MSSRENKTPRHGKPSRDAGRSFGNKIEDWRAAHEEWHARQEDWMAHRDEWRAHREQWRAHHEAHPDDRRAHREAWRERRQKLREYRRAHLALMPYVRLHMHRRIFMGLAVAILFVAIAMSVVGRVLNPWETEEKRIRDYVAAEFADDWSDAAKRAARAHRLNETLGIGVRLAEKDGALIEQVGPTCRRSFDVAIENAGAKVGDVTICYPMQHAARNFFIAGAALVLALWMVAGKVARRLARPLAEVARVAEELGKGNLKARAYLPHDHGEVEDVALALNRMAERIEGQIQDQRSLLASVSHEIRTPLARMRFLVERLRSKNEPAVLDDMDREVLDMDELVGELLAGSRIDFGAMAKKPINVAEMTVALLERFDEPPEKLAIEGEGRSLEADPTLLRRALANLIINARRHGEGLEQLVVCFKDDVVRFSVLDGGPGFPQGEENAFFEPFKASGAEGSIGLGLSLVRRIAEVHGGKAFAENREEKGARVTLEIPRS